MGTFGLFFLLFLQSLFLPLCGDFLSFLNVKLLLLYVSEDIPPKPLTQHFPTSPRPKDPFPPPPFLHCYFSPDITLSSFTLFRDCSPTTFVTTERGFFFFCVCVKKKKKHPAMV